MSKNVFLTEGFWHGKIPRDHTDMRVESAWMHILNADHYPIIKFHEVKDYDNVFIIFPKGFLGLNMVGMRISPQQNQFSDLLRSNLVEQLKGNNKRVFYVQEGPTWVFNDYSVTDQFNFYALLMQVDGIFAHNEFDKKFYSGLFPNKSIHTIPSVMIEDQIEKIVSEKQEKVIVGGNFARWYGGFQSYIISDVFEVEKWVQDSHAKQSDESLIEDLNHLPRLNWLNWMKTLSTFKYAVHLMPTPAAGTFNMNCAYFGIPCIGNQLVDTQIICHPDLCVDINDLERARNLALKLKNDEKFYQACSKKAKENYTKYFSERAWKEKMNNLIG